MDKAQLQKIFSNAYNHENWLEVLKTVFGARQLLVQPKQISLPTNDLADSAFELGNITTTDDRIIGLYKIEVKANVFLERNKVGLRKLLREVYQYDVDGALVVFVQENKWRLSFVSEVKVLNNEGEVITEATEPKRFTYLLGEGEQVQTPTIFLSKLSGKVFSLEDIRRSFSVDVLNEEFYKIIQQKFYELVGGKIGSVKKQTDFGDGKLILPDLTKDARQVYQEFAVRLIGRSVFCWFLKMKKEKNEASLIAEELLSSKAVNANKNYYHTILERLFFQTLNTPMDERLDNLPYGCEKVPFLNGGLFEPGVDDYYRLNKLTGLSENIDTLIISDKWFQSFFEELEKYNFTIDENSVTDVEVSVDPEMLGRIFENLLAEIDPDSGETARKATGSFYTPREIVDYMATESLVQYIHNKTTISQHKLRTVFKMSENAEIEFNESDRIGILKALDTVKILDPACGSGAFPMGVLQKIVLALQKLDKNAVWWIKQRINENKNATARKAVKEKLEGNSQYARKIGIIQNSLYGVDIQPIAAEISKLRCFLTLVVDERIDDSKPNRGIDPLPNLEFKFVTANTLLKLPEQQSRGLFDHFEELEELEQLRTDYLQSSGNEKYKIKDQFPQVQRKIFKEQMNLFVDTESRAYKLSTWEPFGHNKAEWFDPDWMFGVNQFDLVIGNPPYVQLQKDGGKLAKLYQHLNYETFEKTGDIYSLFYERSIELLNDTGILCFITSNKWMRAKYGMSLRHFFAKKTTPILLVDLGNVQVFRTATVDTNILFTKSKLYLKSSDFTNFEVIKLNSDFDIKQQSISHYILNNKYPLTNIDSNAWVVGDKDIYDIKDFIENQGIPLKNWLIKINRGLLTGFNEGFIIHEDDKNLLIQEDSNCEHIIKPILSSSRNIEKWYPNFENKFLITIKSGWTNLYRNGKEPEQFFKDSFPSIYKYLKFKGDAYTGKDKGLYRRDDKGDYWWELRKCAYYDDFEKDKIIFLDITKYFPFVYDENDHFLCTDRFFIMSGEHLKYLTCIFNSKLFYHCFADDFPELQGGSRKLQKIFFEKIPVKRVSESEEIPFIKITDYLVSLKKENSKEFNDNFILIYFEQIANALVFELYFKEEFKIRNLYIAKYISDLPDLNISEIAVHQLRKIYVLINQENHPLKEAMFNMLAIPQIELIMNSSKI
ncbi:Eco57I restriction-modification methylase domain-containing protein [Fluviicola taffensis]|uniref:site-specific DNA-methyltransferase (adenine-specific) n=1 Tax=Fluviicola taffensis (strain DSM 16823 / NCIMB 13979 / RW262) TaxID=755732 RepID=F2IJW5_FLUTR|nr:Eco57I restriction-modification methylase domain-containing protein [Fluviicola taffensis]AEA45024.1 hypothetical protein Fluta_3048 [Fluviicola taffensis DSM 16823]